MRFGYTLAVAALLAASPAMAQVVIGTGDPNAASAHQYQADQDRSAGRANMDAARQEEAMGNYGAAARDREAAHEDWHAAHHQQRDADRDGNGGVTFEFGR